MRDDDVLCLCFGVKLGKVRNYVRQHSVRRASQLAECYGAGTGCGWCRRHLIRLAENAEASIEASAESHGKDRATYRRELESQ